MCSLLNSENRLLRKINIIEFATRFMWELTTQVNVSNVMQTKMSTVFMPYNCMFCYTNTYILIDIII